ncbi:hypothetical protein HPB48_001123 [Haemaphysalis longicornis]|uniref:Uncharacterized protein n=1 Tax=Haemaphysalis longicornis TaxID=44386 RepID=A0A9J6GFH8_HAELO|nr:hypothetical protein HPB48_001123 [Haemaphysalis longicornis]
MEVESPAENRPQQLDLEHQSPPKPCGEMGAGEHPCEESNVARGALCGSHAPGERGDWATAVGDDSAGESTPEYLTPACSLFSLEFYCSTLEVFSSEQQPAVEEEEPSRPSSSDEQRKECPQLSIPQPGYRHLTDDGSSCDASSSDLRSSCSGQPRGASYYSPCSPLFRCTSPSSEDCPSSPAAPPRGEPSSVQSKVELVRGLEEDPLATHVKRGTSRRRGKQFWASLWTGLRRRFQQWALPRRQRKQRGRVGSLLRSGRHATTHGDREDEDDITSSDEFYSASARWNVRRIYRRFVSCLRVVCARRGS